MKLENRMRNGYNGAKSGRSTLLGALVLYVSAIEKLGEKPTRKGFGVWQNNNNSNYGKTVIQLGKKLGVIAPKGKTRWGTVYTLGPKVGEFIALSA